MANYGLNEAALELWNARMDALASGPHADPDAGALTEAECPAPTEAEVRSWKRGYQDWFIARVSK